MNLRIAYALFLLLRISSVTGVCGEKPDNQIKKELEKTFKNKTILIRNFYSGDYLTYNPEGTLISGGESGSWAISGYFKPSGIKLTPNALFLTGNRLYWTDKAGFIRCSNNTIIEIKRTPEQQTLPLIMQPLQRVFLSDQEIPVDAVFLYWKELIQDSVNYRKVKPFNSQLQALEGYVSVAANKTGDGKVEVQIQATPQQDTSFYSPKILSFPMPAFTEQAKQKRHEGMVVLQAIITKEGDAKIIGIKVSLGFGLDENAVIACGKWKFHPALRDGKPVSVIAHVTVPFRLLPSDLPYPSIPTPPY
jgi:TonB family protein